MLMVMTGGTSGLGRIAAEQLGRTASTKIMGARDTAAVPGSWMGLPLDLASLDGARAFVAALPDGAITHLILNAGGQSATAETRTVDGYETTFATNHLAHYLMLRLLMPRLSRGARIVITTSGTHDPREKTGVPPPRHADARLLAYPDRDPAADRVKAIGGMRAYSASKLCNLMTARQLAHSEEAQAGHWSVFAYDPGLTPGTALIRNQPWMVRTLVWPLLPLFVSMSRGMNTLAHAGGGLAELTVDARAPEGQVYAALRKGNLTWPAPSVLAQDDVACLKLWNYSADLVGLNHGRR